MIDEGAIKQGDFSALSAIASKIYVVSEHIIGEAGNDVNDGDVAEGWYCILNEAAKDLWKIDDALGEYKKKGGKHG